MIESRAGQEHVMEKVFPDADAALAGLLRDGMTIMAGGLACAGFPKS